VSGSFSESKIDKVAADTASFIAEYSSIHAARSYPKGSRVNSINYKPTHMWQAGIQIAALNMQVNDKGVHIN